MTEPPKQEQQGSKANALKVERPVASIVVVTVIAHTTPITGNVRDRTPRTDDADTGVSLIQ